MGVKALLAALLAAAPALAQEARPAYKPPYELVFEDGVDLLQASKILKRLKALHGEYPGLFTRDIVEKVVFASPDRGLGNCYYRDEERAIIIDVDTVLTFERRYGGFHREGLSVDALLFHELLHGWAYRHPERHDEYLKEASDGRLTRFERKNHRLFKHLWAIERRMETARMRREAGELSPEEAQSIIDVNQKKLEDYRPRFGLKVERFVRRTKLPARDSRDPHASDDAQEWFAYGGEITYYAREPAGLLQPKELAWWKALEPELKGSPAGLVAPVVNR